MSEGERCSGCGAFTHKCQRETISRLESALVAVQLENEAWRALAVALARKLNLIAPAGKEAT